MGVRLDPAAPLATVGQMPLTMRVAPEGDRVVLSLSGYRQQGIEVVDATSGRVLQDLPQASAFIGLAFSPDGRALYSSGANSDVVYRYRWERGRATLDDSLVLARKAPRATGTRYPSGLALSPDGKTLYVAENLADSLAVIDVANREVIQRLPVGRYPYDVVVDKNGVVYVSAWGANTVSVFHQEMNGWLGATSQMTVARHPSALLLNPDGTRLFVASGSTDHVAVVDTKTQRVIARLLDPPPAGPNEGATPNALALSPDGTRLFVAEGDANAVGIFNLSATTANVAAAHGDDRLAGRIPSGWYPSSLAQVGDGLIVASGKGKGSVANPRGPNPRIGRNDQYSLSLLNGGMMRIPLSQTEGEALTRFSARV
ncbi:MAG: YncE family protein, partial [Deltaproteobacteria bacterium]